MKRSFLITGATKGIGLALSHRLVAAGHEVVGIARHAADYPGALVTADLGHHAETADVLADLTARFHFDGVVNNVGLVRAERLGEVTLDALDAVLSVNLHSAVQCVQALLPGMRAQGWGRIVNISSLTILGMPERTAYAAAKAALVSFARSWAVELAPTGICLLYTSDAADD
ncbi:SDR family NAD(P)-dependent oxidoreductase [Thioclava sp. BHET1]|nr:SDR family NAD(P)-dependent oxidoreductase [Thioclava sp. BHET1]